MKADARSRNAPLDKHFQEQVKMRRVVDQKGVVEKGHILAFVRLARCFYSDGQLFERVLEETVNQPRSAVGAMKGTPD